MDYTNFRKTVLCNKAVAKIEGIRVNKTICILPGSIPRWVHTYQNNMWIRYGLWGSGKSKSGWSWQIRILPTKRARGLWVVEWLSSDMPQLLNGFSRWKQRKILKKPAKSSRIASMEHPRENKRFHRRPGTVWALLLNFSFFCLFAQVFQLSPWCIILNYNDLIRSQSNLRTGFVVSSDF